MSFDIFAVFGNAGSRRFRELFRGIEVAEKQSQFSVLGVGSQFSVWVEEIDRMISLGNSPCQAKSGLEWATPQTSGLSGPPVCFVSLLGGAGG